MEDRSPNRSVGTYTSVCADVHLQAIVLAERFVTVRALVWTLTWGTENHKWA